MNDEELSDWRNLMECGTQCLGEEDYLKAENYFTESLIWAHHLDIPEIVAFTLRLLATVRVRLGNLEIAESGFKEALCICQEIQNQKGIAEAWAGLASVSVKKGLLNEAAAEYGRAIEVYPISSPPLRLGTLYADIGQVYTALKNWPKAKNAYEKAQALCLRNGFLKGEAELDVLLGELFFRQGHYEKAVQYLKHACQHFTQIADVVALANTLQYLALLYFELSEMWKAFECQQRAVALCLKFCSKEIFSESSYFLSKIVQLLGNNQEAIQYLELAIQFYPNKDLDLALRYQSLANLLLQSLELNKAEMYYLLALDFLQENNDDIRIHEVNEALAVISDIRRRKEEPPQFQSNVEEQSPDNQGIAMEALVRLAEYYEQRRTLRDALECYWRALEMGRKAKIETDWIETRVQRVSKRLRRKK